MKYIIRLFLVVALVSICFCKSVYACMKLPIFNAKMVKHADLVVVGRIINYEIIVEPKTSEKRQAFLEKHSRFKKIFKEFPWGLPSYARFEIVVEKFLLGQAKNKIIVNWKNSTFGEPKSMPADKYLIALRSSKSKKTRNPGLNAQELSTLSPQVFTVLQGSCSTAFIFDNTSKHASDVRQILKDHLK